MFRSRQSWSLSVEKHKSSCGPECLVSGGAFLRGSLSDDLCFLLSPAPPSPFPPPSCVLEVLRAPDILSLNGLWTEFQCISSFFGWPVGKEPALALGPSLLLLAEPALLLLVLCGGINPAAAARDDWCVGLPIIVIANGSSEVTGGGRLRSRFLSLSLRLVEDDDEEDEVGSVLVSARVMQNGSPRTSTPLASWVGRGGGRAQASDRFTVSWVTVLSKAARKGSSGGMCLQFQTDDSISDGGRD